jgi:hypothetical protein
MAQVRDARAARPESWSLAKRNLPHSRPQAKRLDIGLKPGTMVEEAIPMPGLNPGNPGLPGSHLRRYAETAGVLLEVTKRPPR